MGISWVPRFWAIPRDWIRFGFCFPFCFLADCSVLPAWYWAYLYSQCFTVLSAGWSGKVKTACTMVGIILMLIFPNATLRLVCVAVILVTTIYSGIEYFVKNKDVLAKGTM